MDVEKPRLKEGSGEKPEFETVVEKTTLNSMVPIWRKRKSEVTDEEYESFTKKNFMILKNLCVLFIVIQKVSAPILHCYSSLPKRLLIITHVNMKQGCSYMQAV